MDMPAGNWQAGTRDKRGYPLDTTTTETTVISSESVLAIIQEMLGSLVFDAWATDTQDWGEKVAMYRRYMDGKHRLELDENMADMLRITKEEDERFSFNLTRLVVTKKADRLKVVSIQAMPSRGNRTETAIKEAQEWTDEVLAENEFDAIQGKIYNATMRDGVTFVVIDPAPLQMKEEFAGMEHEPAYDGFSGVIPIYDHNKRNRLTAAVKIWLAPRDDGFRVNIYYADRVERYLIGGSIQFVVGSGDEETIVEDRPPDDSWPIPWKMREGNEPVGIPLIQFENQGETYRDGGRSEMTDAMPANDVLNRAFMSAVITGENTGFQRGFAKGFDPPQNMSPGTIISAIIQEPDAEGNLVNTVGIPKDLEVSMEVLPAGDLSPLISMVELAKDLLVTITETPLPARTDTQSGEALKQREQGLIGKVEATQPALGSSWGRVMRMSHRVQQAFGDKAPPDIRRWSAKWKSAAIRDDGATLARAEAVRDDVSNQQHLENVAPVFGWDDAKIKTIIDGMEKDTLRILTVATSQIPRLEG